MLAEDLKVIGSEQSTADPGVLRKTTDGKLEVVVVVHMHGITVGTKGITNMQRYKDLLDETFLIISGNHEGRSSTWDVTSRGTWLKSF